MKRRFSGEDLFQVFMVVVACFLIGWFVLFVLVRIADNVSNGVSSTP